ncbi:hypothetical protein NE172_18530 [Clostridium botulinum]|uniref:Uncharacterized protein n=1 Tax=Clostridium botulinum TaxID=1491 RepID=A0A6B4JR91_CLOBO|nr:DUF5131 family protein [Clostridium botulinum]EES50940.1 conserved hypothetical protein [Clostridium botulinum E1 str. 'BoNT E Beluga']MBY6762951.1 hypothetical protein [Clostridium botulinum]MBY6921715.1 hypothetical protein [Clostridium botulinum]MCR1132896.1 hypothetical protein [Clostridium botulinum]NFH70221.1 hypothetical protein [Clostridium botulinum]
MSELWNLWHGCCKISDECENCYMYFLDETHQRNGRKIYKVKNKFILLLNVYYR